MNFKKLCTIAIAIQLMFVGNVYSMLSYSGIESVKLEFDTNEKCLLECDNTIKEFSSLTDLSNEINNIVGKYFTVNSISKIDEMNTIIFQNFNNTNEDTHYNLSICGNVCFKPYIILSYNRNTPDIPTISLDNITTLKIYSSYANPKSGTINCIDSKKMLFNDKPISDFNKICIIPCKDHTKCQNTITETNNFSYSKAIILFFLGKYIIERLFG